MIALDYGYDHVIDTLLDSEAKFDGLPFVPISRFDFSQFFYTFLLRLKLESSSSCN